MRIATLLTLLLLITGCSSGSNSPVVPDESTVDSRVALSEPYTENGEFYIDVKAVNIEKLYQFSLRLEFNPECIEMLDFEPSKDFGSEPLFMFEKIGNIPEKLKNKMFDSGNALTAIAASRPFTQMGDIESPDKLGRIKFKSMCVKHKTPFKIYDNSEYLVFRTHERKEIDVLPVEPEPVMGGDG